MNGVSLFVVFAVTWFLALYCLLPIGVRSQEEAGDDIPLGAAVGAPSQAHLKPKAIGATLIAALITGIAWYLVSEGILTMANIDRVLGMSE